MSFAVHRKVMYTSVILCVVGFVLVLGSLLTETYTTTEPFRVDKSRVQISDSFTLWPNSNKTYPRDSISTNSSIFQININKTGALIFKIGMEYLPILEYRSDFEKQIGGDRGKVRYFWTPPRDSLWLFTFDNPYPTPTNVSVKATEYYLGAVEYREVTHHRPLLEASFAYTGIIAIIVGTGISLACSLIDSVDSGKKSKYRHFAFISVILCIIGVILALESVVTVSYVTLEPFRVDKPKTLLNDSFTLHANTNKTRVFDSLIKNTSILEIHIEMSDAVGIKIIDQANGRVEFSGGDPVDGIGRWEGEFFWTPPISSEWQFVYYNPFSTSRNVSVKVTEHYLKVIEYREVTHNRPLLDP